VGVISGPGATVSIYADTSLFVSLYIRDGHTAEAERRVASRPALWMTPLHLAEWTHAVEQHVFRKAITRAEADRLADRFAEHCGRGLWKQVALPELALDACAWLARKHVGQLGLRMLDTLHVAAALELNAAEFWTFDNRQRKLAHVVGLKAL
jgi:predicted nucleic acid-binding protein